MITIADPQVAAKFENYSEPVRSDLLELRRLVLETAAATDGVGPLNETLKWGQPSYLTGATGSGTTIRIDSHPAGTAIFVNCQTDLVAQFRAHYPGLQYEGTRAMVLPTGTPFPAAALRHCIALTLTYHLRKKRHSDRR